MRALSSSFIALAILMASAPGAAKAIPLPSKSLEDQKWTDDSTQVLNAKEKKTKKKNEKKP
jgi:hypothetical protein